jgi:hypothetical protein
MHHKARRSASSSARIQVLSTICGRAELAAGGLAIPNSFSRQSRPRMTIAMAVTEVQNSVIDILRVPMFESNYGWILRDKKTGKVAAVDPAQPDAIQEALESRHVHDKVYCMLLCPGTTHQCQHLHQSCSPWHWSCGMQVMIADQCCMCTGHGVWTTS